MKQYIVGNWKMNGTLSEAQALARGLREHVQDADQPLPSIILCPPFPYLLPVGDILKGSPIEEGAQDCSPNSKGSFTGDISVAQLIDVGCRYVIIGHSERRQHHRESGALLQNKIQAALQGGLIPIFCLGESEAEYKEGKVFSVLAQQIQDDLPEAIQGKPFLIAYEPVWAIGTGLTPQPEEIEKVAIFLKEQFGREAPPILYGGSVTAQNAGDFLALPSIDGVLVGGASLKVDDFWRIIGAAKR